MQTGQSPGGVAYGIDGIGEIYWYAAITIYRH